MAQHDERLKHWLRAGAIQAFAYTYELSFKMLKRFLEMTEPDPAAFDAMTFHSIIRCGFEKELLQTSMETWKEFRRNRGTTSYAYDDHKAEEVFQGITSFLTEARFLLHELQKRQKDLS